MFPLMITHGQDMKSKSDHVSIAVIIIVLFLQHQMLDLTKQ